ncbi:MAG: heme-binding protein, partial [Gammaproteobacteria bacterium]|nr:heme-binding protein [Gammaproteobacteria bacterium]
VDGFDNGFVLAGVIPALANGTQIFPGSVPIYRGSTLIGGIGVSGDGVDQDDMIAFLGLHEAAQQLGSVNNAAPAMRADTLAPQGTRLRYVNCPVTPYIDSDEQNVCGGK